MKKIIISLLMGAGMCLSAQAADVFRNPGANPLFNASSWTNAAGGNVGTVGPAATDVAVWDNTYSPAAAVAPFTTSSKSWQGIRLGSSLSRDINISTNGTTVVSLTLGTAGIDMSQSAANLIIVPDVVLGSAQTWAVNSTRTLTVSGAVSGVNGSTLTKTGAGTLTLTGNNTYHGGTIISNGTLAANNNNALGDGLLTLAGGVLTNTTATGNTLNNNINLSASTGYVGSTSANFVLAGAITNTGLLDVTSKDAGTVTLSGVNTYTGGTRVENGTLAISGSGTLGSTNGALNIAGGNLNLGGTSQSAGDVTLNGGGTLSNGKLTSSTQFKVYRMADISATLAGPASLWKGGGNPVTLSASNSYSGGTVHTLGMLVTSNLNALGTGGLAMNPSAVASATLRLAQSLNLNGALSSSTNFIAAVDLGANTLTINQSSNSTFYGNICNTNGTGSLVKSGAGTLTLSGANTYSGTTTVSGGGLAVEGSMQSSLIEMNANTILSGTGSVQAVTMDAGSTLSVGNSPGTMTFNGALALMAGSTNIMEIVSGSIYDVLKGNGANTLTMNGETVIDFGGWTGGAVTNGTTFALFQSWNSAGGSGTFSVKNEAALGLTGTQSLDLSQLATGGPMTVIPEPATIGMLGLGALVTLLIRRIGARY